MGNRSIEVTHVGGFRELLYSTVLDTKDSRNVVPDAGTLARIKAAGIAYMERAVNLMDGDAVPYCAISWPEEGPPVRGMIFAMNPRHHTDPTSGEVGFFREFTETEEPAGDVIAWHDADEQLAKYAVAHFGRPKAVE
ncbi:hypothetical protein U5A82_06245 [Sphingobium sp. CR2-8]|uniref:hypothetical protein n=1 Tax=Sphingobium sp. CR2-8 TaxID=1306534 RepID=UPI002DB68A9A|nr:hypothetical protein [Sphingobium sp. CR2-8]MEC3910089.1 hypothetical protein [Sphingobium sp. CR2-8]